MKPLHCCFILVMIIVTGFVNHLGNKETFQRLNALEGTWMMHTKSGALLFECWAKTNDTLMQGKSYRLRGIEMKPQESISLKYNEEGIFYVPVVENQNQGKETYFKLTSST